MEKGAPSLKTLGPGQAKRLTWCRLPRVCRDGSHWPQIFLTTRLTTIRHLLIPRVERITHPLFPSCLALLCPTSRPQRWDGKRRNAALSLSRCLPHEYWKLDIPLGRAYTQGHCSRSLALARCGRSRGKLLPYTSTSYRSMMAFKEAVDQTAGWKTPALKGTKRLTRNSSVMLRVATPFLCC